jgi:hypothetical protein
MIGWTSIFASLPAPLARLTPHPYDIFTLFGEVNQGWGGRSPDRPVALAGNRRHRFRIALDLRPVIGFTLTERR